MWTSLKIFNSIVEWPGPTSDIFYTTNEQFNDVLRYGFQDLWDWPKITQHIFTKSHFLDFARNLGLKFYLLKSPSYCIPPIWSF